MNALPVISGQQSAGRQEELLQYLNQPCLDSISSDSFQHQRPYPWVNIRNPLTPEGYERLRQTLPDISLFKRWVGVKRAHGQGSHDRAILHYPPSAELAAPWAEALTRWRDEEAEL